MAHRVTGRHEALGSAFRTWVLVAAVAWSLAGTAAALDTAPGIKSAGAPPKPGTNSTRDADESPGKTPKHGKVAGGRVAANSPQNLRLAQAPTEKPAAQEPPAMNEYPFKGSQPAPSLSGGVSWINTAGPVDLADLKGKFVILDFWTYCCINCIHILPELKKLEEAYPN